MDVGGGAKIHKIFVEIFVETRSRFESSFSLFTLIAYANSVYNAGSKKLYEGLDKLLDAKSFEIDDFDFCLDNRAM